MKITLEYVENGGDDRTTNAWWITDKKGKIVAVDEAYRKPPEAEEIARTIAQRLLEL
jgi:hypothetical protein